MKSVLHKCVLFSGLFILCMQLHAVQDTGAFSMVERSDWRRYDNGRYTGLVRNEVRASIILQDADSSSESIFYQGIYFVLQSTLRDMRQSAQAVDAIIPVSYEVMKNGGMEIENDRGFPMLRGFPYLPNQWVVAQGTKWRASANRAVDPLNKGQPLIIPFIVEYEYKGIEYYNGIPVHRIYAVYGYNYLNAAAEHPYVRASGNHKVDILIRVADRLPLFMRDDLTVKYTLSDNSTVEFKGFTLTFNYDLLPIDRNAVITSLEEILKIETPPVVIIPEPGDYIVIPGFSENDDPVDTGGFQEAAIELTPVPEGIKLTIKDIRFIADSPAFLPEEKPRLDLLSEALKKIPDRTFLVEGHTASTGQPANEMELSVERARSIINELVKRGINADRFIYKGWGGTKPVGDNATAAGRTANRRVEITILE